MSIPVYTSHRYAYYPDWVYSATQKNFREVRLMADGNQLSHAWPGIPFPRPRSGQEVLWNHLLAYKGPYIKLDFLETTVHPHQTGAIVEHELQMLFDYYNPTRSASGPEDMLLYYLSKTTAPSHMAGGILLAHERINASLIPRQAWTYMPETRKVMRAPSIDYDSPMRGSEAIRFADEIDIYNGSIDRYDWQMLGKRILVIPYNNVKLIETARQFSQEQKALLTSYHPAPEYLRYELHRVWVVRGTLKTGRHHPYQERTLYLDEDSWLAIMADNKDKTGALWRVSLSYTALMHELPGLFKVADVFHDLKRQAYYLQVIVPQQGGQVLNTPQNLPPRSVFMPSHLRRL
jgi:hypothetical protein